MIKKYRIWLGHTEHEIMAETAKEAKRTIARWLKEKGIYPTETVTSLIKQMILLK